MIVMVEVRTGVRSDATRCRTVATHAAPKDAAGELPEAPPGVRRTAVVLDGRSRRVRDLARYARVRHRDGDPLLAGLFCEVCLRAVTSAVLRRLRYLAGADAQPVVPPDAIKLLSVEACRHLWRYQCLYLFIRVGPVNVVEDGDTEECPVPTLPVVGRGYALALE